MKTAFTPYQKLVVAILAFLQFTIILDFMIISPLGAILMPALKISPSQFGVVVSAYAFSAGASGFLAAGYADRFDRKKMLMFFYCGFLIGTFLCGIAPTYETLLGARMVTGLFGGVIGSIVMAITTDLFPMEQRGRVMGVVQTAFAGSQILGIPIGLFLANHWGWHSAFMMIVAVGLVAGIVIAAKLKPINAHLTTGAAQTKALGHLVQTVSKPRYLIGFATTALLSTGGFMLMPFGSAFSVHNVGLTMEQLPMIYLVTGLASMFAGPLVGKLTDSVGKIQVFTVGTLLGFVMVLVYTHMGITPIATVMGINMLLFIAISARMISCQALMSAIPEPRQRGAYMSVSSSVQQVSGGLAAILAGLIVVEGPGGMLERFDVLGYVVGGAMLVTLALMLGVNRMIRVSRPA